MKRLCNVAYVDPLLSSFDDLRRVVAASRMAGLDPQVLIAVDDIFTDKTPF